jgi:hypothetical protein
MCDINKVIFLLVLLSNSISFIQLKIDLSYFFINNLKFKLEVYSTIKLNFITHLNNNIKRSSQNP